MNWKSFQTIQGTIVFQLLRDATSSLPATEMDFQQAFEKTIDVWTDCVTEYPTKWMEYHRLRSGGIPDSTAARLREQLYADQVDRMIVNDGENPAAVVAKMTDFAIQLADEKCVAADESWFASAAENAIDLAAQIEQSGNVMFGRKGKRFGLPELIGIDRKTNRANHPISLIEEQEILRMEAAESDQEDAQEKRIMAGTVEDRKVVILKPQAKEADKNRYRMAVVRVKPHIAATRAALPKFSANQIRRLESQRFGSLDRRRLWSGTYEERVFFQMSERNRKQKNLAVGLLLDESASMAQPSKLDDVRELFADRERVIEAMLQGAFRSRGDFVLDIAALFCESLRNSRANIELEVYSHTSTPDANCQVKYLYGKHQTDPLSIGCYHPAGLNYDGVAIETAAELLRKNTNNSEKILIVISDGAPSNGRTGIKHARTAVESVRRSRIQVVGIAIDAYAAEAIYGTANTLVYDDLTLFTRQLRNLLMKIAR